MTIFRNGEAIELTEMELVHAYYEQQRNFDVTDISQQIEDMLYDGEIEIDYPVSEIAKNLADDFRDEVLDKTGELEWEIRREVIVNCEEVHEI